MSQGQMTNRQQQAPAASGEGDKLSSWLAYAPARARIEAALQPGLNVDQFLAQIEIAFQHPDVKKCTLPSQFEAANKLAMLGLLPSLKHAALIPRRAGNVFEIDVMPQWQGYKALMERHPSVLEVNAYLVHKVDTYEFADGKMTHHYDPFDARRVFNKVDDLFGGYVVITFRDGRAPKYHFCNADYIRKCMNCAQTKNVWNTWFEQQARKTCYRSCFSANIVPMDPMVQKQMGTIIEHDDVLLQNNPNLEAPTGIPAAAPVSRAQQIVQQMITRQAPPPPAEEVAPQPELQDSTPPANMLPDGELVGEEPQPEPPAEPAKKAPARAPRQEKAKLSPFEDACREMREAKGQTALDFLMKTAQELQLTDEERDQLTQLYDDCSFNLSQQGKQQKQQKQQGLGLKP